MFVWYFVMCMILLLIYFEKIVSEWCAHMHKSYDMCRAGTNSDTFRTECASQGGGFAQVFRARAHDLWKPKTLAASLECMRISSALALLVPHGTTDHEGLGP